MLNRNGESKGAEAAWLAIRQRAGKEIQIDKELCELAAQALTATGNSEALEDLKKVVSTL